MSVLNNLTLANSRTPYYALAGESGSNWYTFSSLTGKVFLTDDTGNHVIQAVGNDLFYDNELLAKAADIQDIADWSLYPAISTILMNGNIIQECSSLQISSITAGDIATTTLEATGTIQAGTLATVPGPYTPGNVKTLTLSATSITASSNIQGGTITTTGGIDMTNSGLTRTSNIGLSAFGAPPYGNLTSPDGSVLTWNGASINTGAAGSASQWANYPAVNTVNMNGQTLSNTPEIYGGQAILTGLVQAKTLASGDATAGKFVILTASTITAPVGTLDLSSSNSMTMRTTAGDMGLTAYNSIDIDSGNDVSIKADPGLNPLYTGAINLTAQNGNGGQVNITANPGAVAAFGGKVAITANGGTILLPTDPPTSVTVGGEIDIFANTGSGGLYTLTSAVKIAAAGVNSYAGAIPAVGSLAGYNFIYGTAGVSMCAGLPASGIQFPGTVYIYGIGEPGIAGGVRLQSPSGIQLLSDTYVTNLYPLTSDNLTIQGRSAFPGPEAHVTILDVDTLTMRSGSVITADSIAAANTNVAFTSPIATNAITTNGSNMTISGVAGSKYVVLSNADTVAFDSAGAGALTGVQSINGAVWPPPTGDASLWSQYPATSKINVAGFGISSIGSLTEVSSINGSVYPPVVSSADWSVFPAIQAVNMSSFGITQLASINTTDNFTLTSVSSLGIFTDNGGDLSIAATNGGNVNIGTGNQGDINIVTTGTGNETTIGGDVVNLDATLGVRISAPYLDMVGNNVINVANLNGSAATNLNITSTAEVVIQGATNAQMECSTGSVNMVGQQDANIVATTGAVNITALTEISLQGPVTVGLAIANKNVTVNGTVNATGDVVSSSGVDNYALNTIGALVGGIPSGFRDATEFYVSFDGSDTTGLGSILSPYQTIQKAITQAELVSSSLQICVINVASGHYTENLTFNRGYIVLNGSLQSQTGNEVCEITGSISINVSGTSDLFNRQITFNGFNLTCGAGQAITDTSTTPHIVSFQDCKCFVVNQFFVSTTSAPDMRLYMTNVEIQQTLAGSVLPVIVTNVGQIELERLDVSLSGNCSAIQIGGTSILSRFSLSALETTNTGATLLPMLNITSSTTSTHTLGNVAFAFSSATTKANTSAVYIASGVSTVLLMLNNVFSLQGTSASTNYTVGYNGVGTPAILGVNNTSLNVNVLLPQTTAVQSGIQQIAYTDMNPPNMACYSTTGDQTYIGPSVNTPQVVTFNTTQFQQGTSLVSTSRFYVSSQGNYQITWSICFSHSTGTALVTSFLKKNGTTVANTGSQSTTFSGSSSILQVSPNFILSLNAGDYVELWWNSNALGSSINSTGAINNNPATPGAVFNITQIR